jgi:hypothetical protein
LPQAISLSGAYVNNGYVYEVAGMNYGGYATDTTYYAAFNSDGSVGQWQTSSANLPTDSFSGSIALYNGYLYSLGGYGNTSNQLNSVFYSQIYTSTPPASGNSSTATATSSSSNGTSSPDTGYGSPTRYNFVTVLITMILSSSLVALGLYFRKRSVNK